ncbi:MAG: aminotransferase class V-fold PLP-dependent enzyme [Syntrophomonas sp.]|uniref:aminotransferase class V-fold PLP-dependent enzyme n=1 Tax=Syntrophomonas sp. TaxID=2053627 RepID=UPI002611A37E|nr:aminotransferase class V-fold PLP-dependent enzyme [Syntrophomonas sp.]MDD2510333.1 aminotransferase class V-fold PLP-dependent enzyme [Syntrophomonas sp.]MDD3879244.1 aminotransferase class V-fold PLP-dependent enzyme [Syntrophomonas sp.]MDD4625659.1 aminotransferase class V-fold PLP-dependent enzyme [Syntrophomonas sp.]
MKSIYLDNAATSFPKPESVYRAVDFCQRNLGGNPGRGSSREALKAGSLLLDAREALAALFNIQDSAQIAFCSNVTEALNIGLKGILKPGDHVITTSMEHNAVARPLFRMSQEGVEWTAVNCEPDGSLDPEELRRAIKPQTRMICVLHASNLTGTVMPVKAIGQIARENGILFMLDTAQTAGVLRIDVEEFKIDLLAFTGHKGLLGPQGTGGIYLRPGIDIKPLKEGGTGSFSEYLEHPDFMPDHLESGTLNTPGIAGLLAGINFIREIGMKNIRKHEQELTQLLIDGLKEIPGISLYGPDDINKRTAVLAFNIAGMDCGELSMTLDYEYGVITRSGLHCAPLAHATLGTIHNGACRFSPGFFNTKEEIEAVVKAVHKLARRN